jgi:hypothetical protein
LRSCSAGFSGRSMGGRPSTCLPLGSAMDRALGRSHTGSCPCRSLPVGVETAALARQARQLASRSPGAIAVMNVSPPPATGPQGNALHRPQERPAPCPTPTAPGRRRHAVIKPRRMGLATNSHCEHNCKICNKVSSKAKPAVQGSHGNTTHPLKSCQLTLNQPRQRLSASCLQFLAILIACRAVAL